MVLFRAFEVTNDVNNAEYLQQLSIYQRSENTTHKEVGRLDSLN
jgi:hypothetical protein